MTNDFSHTAHPHPHMDEKRDEDFSITDSDDALVPRLQIAPGYPNDQFRKRIEAIFKTIRVGIAGKGDDLNVWLDDNITTSNAQMAEQYADELLQHCRDECKTMAYIELPEYGLALKDVLPNPYKPDVKRYGDTLYDYKTKLGETSAAISAVRSGADIVGAALEKAKIKKATEEAMGQARDKGYL